MKITELFQHAPTPSGAILEQYDNMTYDNTCILICVPKLKQFAEAMCGKK